MRSEKLLACLLAIGAALPAAPALTGCAGEIYVVETAPPPPRAETVVYRRGYIWVQGHWERRGDGGWRWRPGYYVRERPDMVYVSGHWERRGNAWVWIEGGWRRRPGATITVEGRL